MDRAAVPDDDGAEFDAMIRRGVPRREFALQRLGGMLNEYQHAA